MSIKPVNNLILGGTDWQTSPFMFDVDTINESGGSTRNVIVSGKDSVTLTGAIANGLNYVYVYGATEQTNLPIGYTQLDYIQNGTLNNYSTKYNTGVAPEVGDVIEIVFTPTKIDVSNYLFQARKTSTGNIFGISGSTSTNSIIASWGGSNIATSNILRQVNHKYYVKASFLSTGESLYVKDLTDKTEELKTGDLGSIAPTSDYWLFGNEGGQTLQAVYYTYMIKITNGDTLKLFYLPAKYGDDVGFYDLATDTFITEMTNGRIYGSAANAKPKTYCPINIVSNNGVIQNVIPRTLSGIETLEDSLGNTATARQLLRIGDSVDEQEILSGEITMRNNVTTFTGEEDWTYDSNYGRVYTTVVGLNGGTVARTKLGFCTHFNWIHNQESMSQINTGDCYSAGGGKVYFHISQTSANDWKQFLADELTKGSPVMIAYPMGFEVPIIATAQTLTTQAGTNTISIIDSSISDLDLKVSYKQSI